MRRVAASGNAGFTMLAVLGGLFVVSLVLSGFLFALHAEVGHSRYVVRHSHGLELVARLERELAEAEALVPDTFLSAPLNADGAPAVKLRSTVGFPDRGTLLVARGESGEERIVYNRIEPREDLLSGLVRGSCGVPQSHARGTTARWAGTAEWIEDQHTPSAHEYDGVSKESFGPRYFRGDGTGIVLRGARWFALRYSTVATLTEAERRFDFNGDRDFEDSFHIGSIRIRSWDPERPNESTEVSVCNPVVLQERCAAGSDLDGDGFEDPIFLFDPDSGLLRIRLFLLDGSPGGLPVVKRYETRVNVHGSPRS